METSDLIIVAAIVLGFTLVSGRIQDMPITPAMLFVAAGLLLGWLGDLDPGLDDPFVKVVMELTLVIVLFTDASRIDLRRARRVFTWPLRMLTIGLLGTVALGTATGAALFPDLGFWELVVIAVVLAPTDAALGRAVVTDRRVPRSVRQTLNIESGLNDGLALPLLTIALAFVGMSEEYEAIGFWIRFGLRQILVGVVVGLALGWFVARLMTAARRRGWMTTVGLKIGGLTVALLAFGVAEYLESSGFIAAFVCGMVVGATARRNLEPIHEFAEAEGQLLVVLTFLLFGVLATNIPSELLTWQVFAYSLLSLTAVRMVPVAISLLGVGLRKPTVSLLAWFGPRGLASIILGLIVIEEVQMGGLQQIFAVVTVTVTLSVVAHGVTAAPAVRRYGAFIDRIRSEEPLELIDVPEMPMRIGGKMMADAPDESDVGPGAQPQAHDEEQQ